MQMPNAFDATNPPFDRLTSQEVETLRAALDIAYFRPDETVIAQNAAANALFVVIKGTIEERDGNDLLALLGPKDSFDSRALVHGKSGLLHRSQEPDARLDPEQSPVCLVLLPRDIAKAG
jgi:CBS domain-containing protein